MEKDDKFHSIQTLQEAMDSELFPFVFRTCQNYGKKHGTTLINKGAMVYVEGRHRIPYAHVKILDVHNEEMARKEHGEDFVDERGNFVGDEYLLPMTYPCKVNFVNRPGKRTRYASIAQVMEDMPRLVRVEEEVVSIPPGGIGKNTLVPIHTLLQVKCCFTCSLNNTVYLLCSCGPERFTFSENSRVNFTAVQDSKAYSLVHCVKEQLLPSVFQFQNPQNEDAVHLEDELASRAMLMAEGPMELLGSVQNEVLVGWVRDKALKSYKTLLMPTGMWNSMRVQRLKFNDRTMIDNYWQRKFKMCPDSDFVEKGLYITQLDQRDALWLKSPKLYQFNLNGSSLKTPIDIGFEDSSDSDDGAGYHEMKPPIPKRNPITHKEQSENTNTVKSQPVADEANDAGSDQSDVNKSTNTPNTPTHKPTDGTELCLTDPVDQNHENQEIPPPIPKRSHSKEKGYLDKDDDEEEEEEDDDMEYDYPDMSNIPIPPIPPSKVKQNLPANITSKVDKRTPHTHAATRTPPTPTAKKTPHTSAASRTPSTPADRQNDTGGDDDYGDYIHVIHGSFKSKSNMAKGKKGKADGSYMTMSMKELQHIMKEDQTCEDFYKMSALQVAYVFKHCGMDAIADVCYKQRLDGRFFKNLNAIETTKGPFNATTFDILKMKQIIFNGWRAKLE